MDVTQQNRQGPGCQAGETAKRGKLYREKSATAAAGRSRSMLNLWGGLGRAPVPAGTHASGVEASSGHKHVEQVGALIQGQLGVSRSKASDAIVPGLDEGCLSCFAEDCMVGAKSQRFKEITQNTFPGHTCSS
jgi:hypothetical protein